MDGGERDLQQLLKSLRAELHLERYTFESASESVLSDDAFALIREEEDFTVIRAHPAGEWARISLGVESSLEAVGLTAELSGRLAKAGISANVVAGLRHDHFFVPWGRREDAVALFG